MKDDADIIEVMAKAILEQQGVDWDDTDEESQEEARVYANASLAALRAQGMEVVSVEAVSRQFDNMAFILNHATLPEQWHEKFVKELAEDRDIIPQEQGKDDEPVLSVIHRQNNIRSTPTAGK